ncbi:MAG: amino acid adenylation enzyme/thioester reductase family protein [Verrucomicrobiales bacterium]|nr:amino acid adenylation enzyme/thioester reductase family protein [Verrucomicrobiales bacterium]
MEVRKNILDAPNQNSGQADLEIQRSNGLWDILGSTLQAQRAGSPIIRGVSDSGLSLSAGQQRFWFIQQSDPENAAYNLAFSWRLIGPLNVAALEHSINAIVQRHDIFRTTFSSGSGKAQQNIQPFVFSQLPIIDLQFLADPDRESEARRLCAAEGRKPFDLSTGPLFRVHLYRLGTEQHLLLFAVHHVAFDGTSLGIFYRELQSFYQSFIAGKQCVMPDLPVRYADFAKWEEEFIAGQSFEKQLSFWKEQLKGKLPLLELPSDRPRPPIQTFRGALYHFYIGPEVARILDTFRRQENVSLFVVTLAAFKAVLFRYTGQEDLVVGSLASSRQRSELRNLIGFFVNTQILRSSIHPGLTFQELVAQVNNLSLSALAHADVPFDKIVETLKPDRDPSHTPLFQSLYSFHSLPRKALELQGLKVQQLHVDTGASKFDLSLDVNELADGLSGIFEYNTDLFDKETIGRMASHFQSLIAAAAADPSRPISELPLLSELERQQMLVQWNDTEVDYPRDACIQTLFEEQAATSANETAMEFEGTTMSYSELDRRANQVAHYLRSLGVGSETLVGLCIERSLDMVVAMLGILKAGGAYIPLDPAFPPDRLAFMIEDSQMPLLLTKERLKKFLPENAVRMICLDREAEILANYTTEPLVQISGPGSLAYILYTSGSTGKPKGVQIIQSAVVNFLLSMQCKPGLLRKDVLLAITTLSFDIAGLEIFLPLITGARLVIAPREVAGDGTLLSEQIEKSGISVMQATPATWRLLLQSGWQGCPRLKILCGGEALTRDLADALLPRCAELWNLYGPTETTIWSSAVQVRAGDPIVVGPPIANTQLYVLDERLEPVPIGVPGELCIGGDGLARGYLNRPELTAEKFVPHPFDNIPGKRIYRTGDLVRFRRDGKIDFLGRKDNQVKVRGYRIELGEIESVLAQHPDVQQNVVVAREDVPGEKRLVAYIVPAEKPATPEELRRWLLESLPEYMLPSAFVQLEVFPLTPNGKVDRRALPAPDVARPELAATYEAPRTETEQIIVRIWQEVLNLEKIGIHDNFFELGGYSLLLVKVHSRLREAFSKPILMVEMFRYPTVDALAGFFSESIKPKPITQRVLDLRRNPDGPSTSHERIAVIGLAGRFPGAKNVDEFWQNLRDGIESITHYTDDELLARGVSPEKLNNPNYIKAGATLHGFGELDAAFFGIIDKEAELIDPQQRLFLETAWEGLENAAYNPDNFSGRIGVYAGASMNTYVFNVLNHLNASASPDVYQAMIGNDKDFLATRTSYKLNLRGPSFTVQTACSTALVAIHVACQSLLNGECEMALAGGVSANRASGAGYLLQEGAILSPDGHCRAFDAQAQGTVIAMGAGVVVLKRLSDALRDRDTIHAVIRGTAINNDGGEKMGYTSPSIAGQAEVVAMAQLAADVDPATIGYIEAHGTGTSIGDAIEIAGLTEAFGTGTKKQFCAIGSAEVNIGHLDVAAGVASLIKTILVLKNKQIPPHIHFDTPNPKIDFENSPFYINTELQQWNLDNGTPRRAGVSAFGIGGTNAHAVLEEAPPVPAPEPTRPFQILLLSAKTKTALRSAADNLSIHFKEHPEINLADTAYSLQMGRRPFHHRGFCVAADTAEAVDALGDSGGRSLPGEESRDVKMVFLFSGEGEQLFKIGCDLYKHEKVFHQAVDQCSEILKAHLACDLRELVFHSIDAETATQQLKRTALAQPALFMIEYALAQLWMSWGIKPEAMLGHGIGEYVAACLAGVFTLPDALYLISERGRLMEGLPLGSMLVVPLSEKDIQPFLNNELALAANNGPCSNVISGCTEAVDRIAAELLRQGLDCKRLHVSHAMHSPMMEPISRAFMDSLKKATLMPPKLPFISNLTGTWIKSSEAVDPAYWVKHLRHTVRFSHGIQELLKDPARVFLELGPGQTLAAITKLHSSEGCSPHAFSSLPHTDEQKSGEQHILTSLGHLWSLGAKVDWAAFYAEEKRRRIPLPTYPFERRRYWIDAPKEISASKSTSPERAPLDQWFYTPSWKRSSMDHSSIRQATNERSVWLIFADRCGVGESLARQLKQLGQVVTLVSMGKQFAKTPDSNFIFNPDQPDNYNRLFEALPSMGRNPSRIVHLWSVTVPKKDHRFSSESLEASLELNFYSLLHLAQAIRQYMPEVPVQLKVISNGLQEVIGNESIRAEKALLVGPCFAIGQENRNVQCSSIDVVLPESVAAEAFNELLLDELFATAADSVVAHRGGYRWVQLFEATELKKSADAKPVLRQQGVYLITGGLGGIGFTLAEHLAKTSKAKLILIARTPVPERTEWKQWIQTHDAHDPISCKIRKIENLESLGAEVMVIDADVADVKKMNSTVAAAEQSFGKINGVIHAAGIAGQGLIELKTRQAADEVLSPKVHGVLALHEAFHNRHLDFFVLCSSVNALFGGIGQADYGSANAFLDGYARQQKNKNVFSINWYAWQEVGMAVNSAVPPNLQAERETTLRLGIRPVDGIEAFTRILDHRMPQVIVSPEEFNSFAKRQAEGPEWQATPNGRSTQTHARPENVSAYVEPGTKLEMSLAEMWQDVLGIDKVGARDDFFQLGGHSLLALTLIGKIKKLTGKDLPLAVFIEAPTIQKLATLLGDEKRYITGKADGRSQIIVPIKPGGTRPPFFCVHGVGGSILEYSHLARYLDADQPLYGIQAQGVDGKEFWLKTIDEMVERYLNEIKAVQTKGPYYLGGSSFGGLVAFEMAQRLQASGEKVALLAFFDSYGKDYPTPLPAKNCLRSKFDRELSRLDLHLTNLRSMKAKDWPDYLREKASRLPLRFGRKAKQLKQDFRFLFLPRALRNQFKWTGDDGGNMWHFKLPKAYSQIADLNVKSCLGYQFKPYAGNAVLFRATKQPPGIKPDPSNGWSELIQGNLEIINVTGYHGAIVREPLVRGLAAEFNRVLNSLDTSPTNESSNLPPTSPRERGN